MELGPRSAACMFVVNCFYTTVVRLTHGQFASEGAQLQGEYASFCSTYLFNSRVSCRATLISIKKRCQHMSNRQNYCNTNLVFDALGFSEVS